MDKRLLTINRKKSIFKTLIRYHNYRLKRGVNFLITGNPYLKTGVGKSYTALYIAEENDKYFSVKERVAWTPQKFFQVIQSWDEHKTQGRHSTIVPSQSVILDEAEVLINNRTYMNFVNRTISHSLATVRYKRGIVFVVTPIIGFIDSAIRKLTDYVLFTYKTLLPGDAVAVYSEPREVVYNFYEDKMYYKRLTMYNADLRRIVRLSKVKMPLPSQETIEEYEKLAKKFKDQLGKKLLKEIEEYENKLFDKDNNVKTSLEELAQKVLETPELRERLFFNGKVYAEDLRDVFGLTYNQARRLKRIILKMWKGDLNG